MKLIFQLITLCLVLMVLTGSVIFAVNTLSEAIGIMLYIPHAPLVYVSFIVLILVYWSFGGLYKVWLENW